MRIENNPFYILEVTPYDSIETINQKAEDKAFMDDENERKYDDARLTLISPVKRLVAEIRWFYSDDRFDFKKFIENEMTFSSSEDFDDFVYDLDIGPYSEREQTLLFCEALYFISWFCVSECIINLDITYSNINSEIENFAMEINSSRRKAKITICKDESLIINEIKELFNDINEALNNIFNRFSDETIIKIAHEILDASDYYTEYGLVYERFINLYANKFTETLKSYKNCIFDLVEDLDKFNTIDDLNELCSLLKKFDYIAKPLQVYASSRGQYDLQKESVDIGYRIRQFAMDVSEKNSSTEMALVIVNLELDLFTEQPKLYKLLKEDKAILEKYLKFYRLHANITNRIDELYDNIVMDDEHERQNYAYIRPRLDEYANAINDFRDKIMAVEFFESQFYASSCDVIARLYYKFANVLTWAGMWQESLTYYKIALQWAMESKNNEFISLTKKRVNDVIKTIASINRKAQIESQYFKNITYEGEWGFLNKKKIKISPKGIEWNDRIYKLEKIKYVSWGILNKYINGIPTGTDRIVKFGSDEYSVRIDLGKNVYHKFIDCLWNAVAGKIIKNILENFRDGYDTGFGEELTDVGINYHEHKWFSKDIDRFYTWEQIRLNSYNGYFQIENLNGDVLLSFSYMEHYNTHMLETILSLAIKKRLTKLSDLLKQ